VNVYSVEIKLHKGEKEDVKRDLVYSAPTCPFHYCGHKADSKQQQVFQLSGETWTRGQLRGVNGSKIRKEKCMILLSLFENNIPRQGTE